MRKLIVVAALVLGLLVAMVPFVSPAQAWGSHSSTPSATATYEMKTLKWISDNVALTKIQLSPFMKAIINKLIKWIGPALCPALAGFAAPDFKDFVLSFCNDMVASADPLGAALEFIPLLCSPGVGETVFPSFKDVLPILCGILV